MRRLVTDFAYLIAFVFAAAAFIAALPGSVYAGPIAKFEFTAQVFFAGEPWTSAGINVGDAVSGSVSYDLASADTEGDGDFGRYFQTLASGVSVSVGGLNFTSSNYIVDILDDPLFAFDSIGFLFNENVSDGGITVLGLGNSPFFSLSGPSTVFDGDALLTAIDLSLFTVSRFGGLLADGQGATQLQYEITSVTRIPEPASQALFLAGLLVIVPVAYWRRRPRPTTAGYSAT